VGSFINFNGSILPSGTLLLTADNRGFRYGDGVFETIRVKDGGILFSLFHFERLLSGTRLLQFDPLPFPDPSKLEADVLELCKRNDHLVSARVRLTVFRGDIEDSLPNYVIQSWPLGPPARGSNVNGLILGVFPDGRKSCDLFANIKSNNYLIYSMAALYARQQLWDDCLVLNSRDRVADSSIANIFYMRNGVIYTPPLSEGCVAGVMRRRLLEILPEKGFKVEERPVTPEDIRSAEGVFLTNAIRGIRWVSRFGEMIYDSKPVQDLEKIVLENLY
jgi:branched-chain amino acid aminotransferase